MGMDELSGMNGLKQIYKSLISKMKDGKLTEDANTTFKRHSEHFLNRCFRDWKR